MIPKRILCPVRVSLLECLAWFLVALPAPSAPSPFSWVYYYLPASFPLLFLPFSVLHHCCLQSSSFQALPQRQLPLNDGQNGSCV